MSHFYVAMLLLLPLVSAAQEPAPKDPVAAINEAFAFHQLVLLGDMHNNVQEHRVLLNLVQSPEFQQSVNDIVLEGMNAQYQAIVDRFIAGEDVSEDQLHPSWRDGFAIGPVADAPEMELLLAIRNANRASPPKTSKIRVVCGEAALDWNNVHSRDDLQPFVPMPDQNYLKIVKEQVTDKHHKALLYMGFMHFRRSESKPSLIEQELQRTGATTYVVLPGNNTVGSSSEVDPRFVKHSWPWLLAIQGTWLANLDAKPVLMGGNESNAHVSGTLGEDGDAFLFLGPRDELTQFLPKRSTLDGTEYGKEMKRRLQILYGEGKTIPDFLPKDDSGITPQFPPPLAKTHP